MECYRKTIEVCPRDTYANSNLALCLLFTPDPDSGVKEEALELTQRAVNTNPDDPAPHLALADAWAADGQTTAAVGEVNKAIELDPQDSDARFILPFIQSGDTMYGAFKSQSPILCWIWYEHGWLYSAIVLPAAVLWGVIYWVRRRMARKAWDNPLELSAVAAGAIG
jgi:tetratricopeptide (TPR) repeat protein